MCGIVAAISQRNITPYLIDGLKRLEYRGYDSAGIAVINAGGNIERLRTSGKVTNLESLLEATPVGGQIGIAHTRWATHGQPTQHNAHPHLSNEAIAVVHNGIIENHNAVRDQLIKRGYDFTSETDSEITAHLIHYYWQQGSDFITAVKKAVSELDGALALGIVNNKYPNCLVAVRKGSPLVIGLGEDENFVASDHLALLSVAEKFIYLEEGDIAEITAEKVTIWGANGKKTKRPVCTPNLQHEITEKGQYSHYMLKEVFEQGAAIAATLAGRLGSDHVLAESFGAKAAEIFPQVKAVQIVACGTSYYAGMVARYWFEELAGIPCQVEIASEIRYRKTVVQKDTLFVCVSQSGETADTLAALRQAKELGYLASLAICNVAGSSLVRESDMAIMTQAGIEIGVASTKAFTTQLVVLLMLTMVLARNEQFIATTEAEVVAQLKQLPAAIDQILNLDEHIKEWAAFFANKQHALFLGRGVHYPIALEGALKLKELSYIHAEAYPAGELKHGPLALVDQEMPVVAVAPNDELLEKLRSNLHEVRARGGELFVFADHTANLKSEPGVVIIEMPAINKVIAPIVYTVPLQLLAYHTAVIKGTDVDQPRNLAKSVTVE